MTAVTVISEALYIITTPTNFFYAPIHATQMRARGPILCYLINPMALELDIYSLAHHLCTM